MNTSDSEKIAEVFEKSNYESASNINEADLIIVNMCSVRQSAVNRVYGVIEKLKELNRAKLNRAKLNRVKLKTILTGCILRKDRKKFEKIFDLILDIKDLKNWPKKLQYYGLVRGTKKSLDIKTKSTASISIMTGCNNFCSYCVVPYTRGREISRPAEEIICEVRNLIKRGTKEIWLLGQNVNSYENGFLKLLKKINKIPGDFWIRFTSSHPKDFSDNLIKVMKSCEKITPYLNLPVQAGDDKVLKIMNRPYTIKKYKDIIKKVRKEIPGICLSTDVIVGFPGETKKQFENTVKLFREIKYDMAYISQYSPRPGTIGAKLNDNVSLIEKDRRKKVLNEILKQTALENNKKYLGKTVEVLIISGGIAKTKTNKTVKIEPSKNLIGKFIKVKITEALPWSLKGEYVK
jgi:tRNA-2-methylthio-N6-dimethylallyladenosine synthase